MHKKRYARFWREFGRFLWEHILLLLFVGVFLVGVIAGCSGFAAFPAQSQQQLSSFLALQSPAPDFSGFIVAVFSHYLLPFLLILLLALSGLSACGVPFIALVPVLYGLGIGMQEAYYFSTEGGTVPLLIAVLPPTLLLVWTLGMACSEALRMTLRLSRQMLPGTAVSGNLWPDLKLYLTRFLLFLLLALGAALLQTVICKLYFG